MSLFKSLSPRNLFISDSRRSRSNSASTSQTYFPLNLPLSPRLTDQRRSFPLIAGEDYINTHVYADEELVELLDKRLGERSSPMEQVSRYKAP